jgi:hypothetical protein
MRYLVLLVFVLTLGVMGSAMGCGEDQCLAPCINTTLDGELYVNMDPRVESPYEADLVLDGATGAFTCGSYMNDPGGHASSVPTNRTGSGESVYSECSGLGFTIVGTPASVEISVNAQDGSWTGSVKESPNYERTTTCGTLCPPRAVVAVEQQ